MTFPLFHTIKYIMHLFPTHCWFLKFMRNVSHAVIIQILPYARFAPLSFWFSADTWAGPISSRANMRGLGSPAASLFPSEGAAWRMAAVLRAVPDAVVPRGVPTLAGVIRSSLPLRGCPRDAPSTVHGVHESERWMKLAKPAAGDAHSAQSHVVTSIVVAVWAERCLSIRG